MTRLILLVAAMALLVSGCASGADPAANEPEPVTVPTGDGVPKCGELAWFTGPEELYADTPVYVGNEMPIETVVAYANGMDGFAQAWIDREHNGWINVGFVDVDLDAAQAELDEAFPDEGVVAVGLPFIEAELEEIRRRVAAALPEEFDASSFHPLHGRVEVWVGSLTDENVELVEQLVGDEPVCVSGSDPATTPEPGPQPKGGEGWTYLGDFDVSLGANVPVAVAGTANAYAVLWSGLGGEAEPPEVDFDDSVVVAVETGYSGSCPETRLDEITIDDSAVEFVINTITDEMACTDDYNPRVYVVELAREVLPEPPFTVGPSDAPAQARQIQQDLREPGSEPGGLGPAPEPEPESQIPSFVEPGFPREATLDLRCGIEWLGEVNGVHWRTDSDFPEEWETEVLDGDLLPVILLLSEGPEPSLTVTAGNHEVTYEPATDAGPGPCEGNLP